VIDPSFQRNVLCKFQHKAFPPERSKAIIFNSAHEMFRRNIFRTVMVRHRPQQTAAVGIFTNSNR
jgi:hypothetical protein